MRYDYYKLFVSYQRLYRLVFKDIVSRWLKIELKFVGIDIFIFSVYSIRVVLILVVKVQKFLIIIIMDSVGWFLENIFMKYYNKIIFKLIDNFGK